MEYPIRPNQWPMYWQMRDQFERIFEARVDAAPRESYALVDWLAEHCFGCGDAVDSENELCVICAMARIWQRN